MVAEAGATETTGTMTMWSMTKTMMPSTLQCWGSGWGGGGGGGGGGGNVNDRTTTPRSMSTMTTTTTSTFVTMGQRRWRRRALHRMQRVGGGR